MTSTVRPGDAASAAVRRPAPAGARTPSARPSHTRDGGHATTAAA